MPPRGRGRATRSSARASLSNSINHTQESTQLHDSDLSSAPLPSSQRIYLAHAGVPTTDELDVASRTGAEAVSDAVHALRHPLIPVRPWKRLWDPSSSELNQHRRAASSSSGAEWRTARLAYPCSCEMIRLALADDRQPPHLPSRIYPSLLSPDKQRPCSASDAPRAGAGPALRHGRSRLVRLWR